MLLLFENRILKENFILDKNNSSENSFAEVDFFVERITVRPIIFDSFKTTGDISCAEE